MTYLLYKLQTHTQKDIDKYYQASRKLYKAIQIIILLNDKESRCRCPSSLIYKMMGAYSSKKSFFSPKVKFSYPSNLEKNP